jgi:hypothetical protein
VSTGCRQMQRLSAVKVRSRNEARVNVDQPFNELYKKTIFTIHGRPMFTCIFDAKIEKEENKEPTLAPRLNNLMKWQV